MSASAEGVAMKKKVRRLAKKLGLVGGKGK
jgi:hypothetical protein